MLAMGLRRQMLILVSVTAIMLLLETGSSEARVSKGDLPIFGSDGSLNSRLPRGPVPPSGPSLCHNSLQPYSRSQYVSPQDETILCP
ncbi:hypothetical protein R6Q59_012160 [Mikania micrantha]